MSFRTVETEGPLRLIVVGAGGMGRAWARAIQADPDTELVGIADLFAAAAESAAQETGIPGLAVGSDAVELARRAGADAIVNATVPEAHHPVTTAALLAGFPVLGEKPVAASVAEGLSLAAAAELTGQLFMVSQSRRYHHALHRAKRRLAGLGAVGIVAVDFFKAPRFGGFRDEMASPLLLDMAIHQFDMARFLLDADPVSVSCEEYNPAWSWYAGDAAATAVFAMEGGARFTFNGSWCSPGFETSWNGSWRISAERGTVLWDGEGEPRADPEEAVAAVDDPGLEIAGSLREFVAAVRRGTEPMGRVHANVMSLAMVEAATQSAAQGRRVVIDDVLDRSYEAAIATERNADVLAAMKAWTSVREVLSQRSHRSE
ncbi:Gfo/Idh/MocA family oxidoreductase [Glycomyces sp. TRM65418]|uniref:Gfo/Idh/MocA family protein n=1 Tax=Glycomyces sp. TRM65418 TaxID=2867006 RepID=UPI001CE65EC7|nr:Gfo/Idh/MocA family oxidoreductase [Glycomyces sp. TRM65418]MCC3761811.1 Gfo/Idh/MocA family oxidoreductase [Glycomyces sp. TRM65418]QZD55894.1 Gfo/Idh/MocA family oxidoreductase [Glycomyces sp. TRM65418]